MNVGITEAAQLRGGEGCLQRYIEPLDSLMTSNLIIVDRDKGDWFRLDCLVGVADSRVFTSGQGEHWLK